MSRSLSFSKRTVAIALAASVVASGAQVVAPSFETPFGAAVAQAQQAGHIQNSDVKFIKLESVGGQELGDVTYSSTQGPGEQMKKGALLKFEIDIKNAQPGDTITITPRTSYTNPVTGKDGATTYSGLRLVSADATKDLSVNGVKVANLNVTAGSSATITFTDGVTQLVNGSAQVDLPTEIHGIYPEGINLKESRTFPTTGEWVAQIKTTGSGNEINEVGNRKVTFPYTESTPHKPILSAWGGPRAVVVDEGDMTANLANFHQRLPFMQDTEVTLRPLKANDNDVDWKFNEGVKPVLELWTFNDNGTRNVSKGGTITDMKRIEKMGIKLNYQPNEDGSLTVTVTGVENVDFPNGVKPIVVLKGNNPYVGTGPYISKGKVGMRAEIKDAKTKAVIKTVDSRFDVPPSAGLDGAGDAAKPQAEATAAIDGKPEGAGVDFPARIAGKETTFNFTVTNTGNVPITKVEVTDPEGNKTEKVLDEPLAPGKETVVAVDYSVPGGADKLEFSVTAMPGALDLGTFEFLVDQGLKFTDNGDGTVTLIDPEDNEVIVVTKEEYDKLADRVKKLEEKKDIHLVAGERNEDNSITLTLNNGQKITIPAARKAGLEKCLNAPGGTLLALLPVLGIAAAGLSQVNVEAINKTITDWQKGAGIYNEQAARFVAQNRGALGALLGSLVASLILFVPGLCGDVSLAGALKEAFGEGSSKKAQPETKPEEQPEENAGE